MSTLDKVASSAALLESLNTALRVEQMVMAAMQTDSSPYIEGQNARISAIIMAKAHVEKSIIDALGERS